MKRGIGMVGLLLVAACVEEAPELGQSEGEVSVGQGSKLQSANLNGSKLQGSKLQNAMLNGSKLQNAMLNGSKLQGSELHAGGVYETFRTGNVHYTRNSRGGAWQGPFRGGVEGMTFPVEVEGQEGVLFQILSAHPDTTTNTVSIGSQSNSDIWIYAAVLQLPDGTTANPCTGLVDDGACEGILVEGTWNDTEAYSPEDLTFAGLDGVIAKCARWGYKPWSEASVGGTVVPLEELFLSCIRAAKADPCGNGTSGTVAGTAVDVYDNFGINRPVDEMLDPEQLVGLPPTEVQSLLYGFSGEAWYNKSGAWKVEKARFQHTDWTALGCTKTETPDLENLLPAYDWFEPTQAAAMVAHQQFLIGIESSKWCQHSVREGAPYPWPHLAKDCNRCTRAVCSMPGYDGCCTQGLAWTTACSAKAESLPTCAPWFP